MPNLWSDKLNNLIEAGRAVENDYDPHQSIIKILENETVYIKSDMSADADGSPRATQIDPDGQLETSLRRTNGWRGEGDNVNAEKIPYFVLPGNFKIVTNVSCKFGDMALVRYRNQEFFAIYADAGPKTLLGEGSIKLIELLGGNPWNQDKTKIVRGINFGVEYLVFPRSSERFGIPTTFDEIQSVGRKIFDATFNSAKPQTSPVAAQPAIAGQNSDVFLKLAETVNQSVPAKRLVDYKLEHKPTGNPRYWAIVDFGQHSKQKRLYVFDTKENNVAQYLVAHGKGSDIDHNGMADDFSNVPGSLKSSLGIYRCGEHYDGIHELSMRLDGLEHTNSNARNRNIVFHRADYVSDKFIKQNGKIGRSNGCFVVENAVCETLIRQLENGSYLIAWKP